MRLRDGVHNQVVKRTTGSCDGAVVLFIDGPEIAEATMETLELSGAELLRQCLEDLVFVEGSREREREREREIK